MFVTELTKLTEYCQFGDTPSDMPWDWLVCRISDQKLQRHLLAEPSLPLKKHLLGSGIRDHQPTKAPRNWRRLQACISCNLTSTHKEHQQGLNNRAERPTAVVEQITALPIQKE